MATFFTMARSEFPKFILLLLTVAIVHASTELQAQDKPVVASFQDAQPMVEPYLMKGQLGAGEKALEQRLATHPGDDQARFGLGVLQFLQGVEHLGTSLSKFGIESRGGIGMDLPFLRFPVAKGEQPDQVELADVHEMLKTIVAHLDKSDQTLSKITSDDVRLPLHLFQINFDFNGDGVLSANEENFDKIAQQYFGRPQLPAGVNDLRDLVVVFDRSDVYWLQAYSHLLRSFCELVLAYDQTELWDVYAHHVFENAKVKFDFLVQEKATWEKGRGSFGFDFVSIVDAVAAVHNLRFKLKEPERIKKAEEHMQAAIKLSRKMWDSILAETDNDREWLPSPDQQSVITNARITKERVKTWLEFLDEIEDVLSGETLLPFWRGTDETRGVNLKKFFDKPEDIDVVLWVHGAAAINYLENGNVTSAETWMRFQRVFDGDFIGFAAWIN